MQAHFKEEIVRITKEIVRLSQPLKIILFGSAATENVSEKSDLDFLVVVPNEGGRAVQKKILRELPRNGVPLDLFVVPEAFYQQKSQQLGSLYYVAKQEGRIVYERIST